MNCCFMKSKKQRTQVENFLHFEETPEQFPIEFCLLFGGAYEKKIGANLSADELKNAHYRTRSGNQEAIVAQMTKEDDENQRSQENENVQARNNASQNRLNTMEQIGENNEVNLHAVERPVDRQIQLGNIER